MGTNSASVIVLLNEVKQTVQRHDAQARERGEDFNLFSIMGMESNETYTHSAIIAALIDPQGNHYKESKFLELFLNIIGYDFKNENLDKTKVTKEYHIGKIDENYENGGFIDILLTFNSGKTIAIENKIYAKDQHRQLYRYSRYNPERTNIFYLNLFGHSPHPHSYCTLALEDITILSYREHILKWLDKCLSICKEGSVLYSSIRQYQILLKKLTNTMDKTREKELTKTILNNYEAANYVKHNFDNIVYNIRENFRQTVIKALRSRLASDLYLIEPGNPPNFHFSQIWVRNKNVKSESVFYGIESFSGKGNKGGKIFVGIYDQKAIGVNVLYAEKDKFFNSGWPVIRLLKTIESKDLHLDDPALLRKLENKDSQSFKDLVDHVTIQIVQFIKEYDNVLTNLEPLRF